MFQSYFFYFIFCSQLAFCKARTYAWKILIVLGHSSGSGVDPEVEGRQPGPEESTEPEAQGKLLLQNKLWF